MTSLSDLDSGLQRVASKILSCRNQPAELNPSAMTRQLQEAQVGRAHAEKKFICRHWNNDLHVCRCFHASGSYIGVEICKPRL